MWERESDSVPSPGLVVVWINVLSTHSPVVGRWVVSTLGLL